MSGRLLIAGVGNIFLGDDGFGVEVAARLASAQLPGWAHVVDYGIRGMHLAYDLANGYQSMILIDATARGSEPGTIYVIEPDLQPLTGDAAVDGNPLFNAHGMQPDVVFGMLGMLDSADPEGRPPGSPRGSSKHVIIVGCEPASLDHGMGLSEPVAAAVDEAVRVVLDLVAGMADGEQQLVGKERTHVPRDPR